MMGTTFPVGGDYLPPFDGQRYLSDVDHLLRDADLTFANLEGPFIDGGTTRKCGSGSNCYAFRTPTRYGRYLVRAGIDLVSVANNHAMDFGRRGMRSTTHMLDSLGIAWSGPPGTFASLERSGLRVGLVAFHTAPTSNHLNSPIKARRLVRSVAADHDIVIVSFHGGAEGTSALHVPDRREYFYGEDRGYLRRFARRMIDAGADLILGHGPHVPRAMEFYRGRLIAYSLGNFGTYGRFSLGGPLGLGLVLDATLDEEGRFVQGRILSTRQIGEGIPVPDPSRAVISLVKRLSRDDFEWSGAYVLSDGRLVNLQSAQPLAVRDLQPRYFSPPENLFNRVY